MEDNDIINQIFNEENEGLLIDYYMNTLFVDSCKFTKGLKPSDFDIILSTYGGGNNEIFHSLCICNSKFDPNTSPSRRVINYDDLKPLVDQFQLGKETIGKQFKEVGLHIYPKIRRNLRFDITLLNYKIVKNGKVVDYKMEHNNDKKDILCMVTSKLDNKDKKVHKFNKIIQMLEQFREHKDFWDSHKMAYFIFCINNENDIIPNYEVFPKELKNVNEEFDKVRLLFFIDPKGDNETEVLNIFSFNDYESKSFYFHLNSDNEIYKTDDMLCSGDIIENAIKRKKNEDIEKNKNKEELIKERNKAFMICYDFLKNIKKYKYHLFFGFEFEVCLKINDDFSFSISYIDFDHIIAELRTNEYNIIKYSAKFLSPEICEIDEIPTMDIPIDFNSMNCFICKNEIKEPDLFYCYICNKKYCRGCVIENYTINKGKGKFIDPEHNLLYFKTRDISKFKCIDKLKLGENKFSKCDDSKLGSHSGNCCGCDGNFENSPRYLCLHCKPGKIDPNGYSDYCQKCIDEMMKDTSEGKNIEMKNEDKVYNDENTILSEEEEKYHHNNNEHIYLMIALECKIGENSYYEF